MHSFLEEAFSSSKKPAIFAFSSEANERMERHNSKFQSLLRFDDFEELNHNLHSIESLYKKGKLDHSFLSVVSKKLRDFEKRCPKEERVMVRMWMSKVKYGFQDN
jgi:hypothetical protein